MTARACGKSLAALAAAFFARDSASLISAGDKVEPSSACSVLSPSLLSCLHDFVHVRRWPNLENVAVLQRRMLADELYSVIHVPRLKDKYAAELFLGFRIGPSVVATLPFFQYRVKAVSGD